MAWLSQSTRSRSALSRRSVELIVESLESRVVPYSASGNLWPRPQLITIGFVPDGTTLSGSGTSAIKSNLISTFNSKFGAAAVWQNQILKAAQQWAAQTNINFKVLTDLGGNAGSGSYQQGDPTMADIRIGGYNFGTTTISTAYMPPQINNYSISGDINFNLSQSFNIGTTYDLFSVALHEFGHALGLNHGASTSVMNASYTGTKTGLTSDDISGIRALYSAGATRSVDSYDTGAANNTFATATTVPMNVTSTSGRLTGLDLTTTTDLDYFKITVPTGTSGTLAVRAQSTGLSLLTPKITVYASDQVTIKGTNTVTGYQGGTATVSFSGVTAGQVYYVKVQGADTTVMSTGAYALTVNAGSGAAPTVALPNTQVLNGTPLSNGGGIAIHVDLQARVNTTTTGIQQLNNTSARSIGLDSQGNYVVTWMSPDSNGTASDIYAQRFDPNGIPQGPEFRVNTVTGGTQSEASITVDPYGNFTIVWASQATSGGSLWEVYAKRYDAAGTPLGGQFRVNFSLSGDQRTPVVGNLPGGGFVVAWAQKSATWDIYAQEFDDVGAPLGGPYRVNSTTTGDQQSPDLAVDPYGNVTVVWVSQNQDGSDEGIYAQRYNAVGIPLSTEFRVNSTTQGSQTSPSVAVDASARFWIAWTSRDQDGSGWGVYAQRYTSLGAKAGTEFRVNTTTTGDQAAPSVGVEPGGNAFIAWQQTPLSSVTSPPTPQIYYQQYASDGSSMGEEMVATPILGGNEIGPSVGIDGAGHAVIVWSGGSTVATFNAIDASGVFMQRFSLAAANLSSSPASENYEPFATTEEHEHSFAMVQQESGETGEAPLGNSREEQPQGQREQNIPNSSPTRGGSSRTNPTTSLHLVRRMLTRAPREGRSDLGRDQPGA